MSEQKARITLVRKDRAPITVLVDGGSHCSLIDEGEAGVRVVDQLPVTNDPTVNIAAFPLPPGGPTFGGFHLTAGNEAQITLTDPSSGRGRRVTIAAAPDGGLELKLNDL